MRGITPNIRIVPKMELVDSKVVFSEDVFQVDNSAAHILSSERVLFEGSLEECIAYRKTLPI